MPIAFSSCPVMVAAVRASSTLRPAPRAIEPGNCVAGGPTRVTTPCSWSVAITSGTWAPDPIADFCRPLDRPVICVGFFTLSVQAK